MFFDPHHYPYPSRRTLVYAKNAMTASSHPAASAAGLDLLRRGGNAVDAAIAMATVLTVAEPTCNGIGSDNFTILWYQGKMYGLNASGPAPASLSIQALKDRGLTKIPSHGVVPITVPGAPAGWAALHERFGKLSFEECLAPAISYAQEGCPVSPTVAALWKEAFETYSAYQDQKEFQGWFDTFAPQHRPPKAGQLFSCPAMAQTLNLIAKTNARSFYQGELAEKIHAFMKEHQGFLTGEDLASYAPQWVDPICVSYRGYHVWEMPPNGHGITVLMALAILKNFAFLEPRDSAETLHRQIEALKLSFVDAQAYVAEPEKMNVSIAQLLSPRYAKVRQSLITHHALDPQIGDPTYGSTVYFAAADKDGNMVSMIQSNYRGFGSGILIPGTGIALNDRGENFSFQEGHCNALEGKKRPYHTIIPGFLTQNGKAVGPFGIMGGFMQPQAHVQVISNMLDFQMNPQAALDAPRWQWMGKKTIQVESHMPQEVLHQLRLRGHDIILQEDFSNMGRGQIILRDPEGIFVGATEKRTDGSIASW